MSDREIVGRRYFMKSGLAAAAGTASLTSAQARGDEAQTTAPSKLVNRSQGIPTRAFGKTGLTLPILAMCCASC